MPFIIELEYTSENNCNKNKITLLNIPIGEYRAHRATYYGSLSLAIIEKITQEISFFLHLSNRVLLQ